jgi:hypothetical protein
MFYIERVCVCEIIALEETIWRIWRIWRGRAFGLPAGKDAAVKFAQLDGNSNLFCSHFTT